MLIYVSGPYSSYGEVEANIQAARQVAIRLWEMGQCPDTGALVGCRLEDRTYFDKDFYQEWER